MTSDARGGGGFSQIWFYKIGFINETSDEGGGGGGEGGGSKKCQNHLTSYMDGPYHHETVHGGYLQNIAIDVEQR